MVGVKHQGSHSHPTLHGIGRTKASDTEFEVICRRCILPLVVHALKRLQGKEIDK